MIDDASPSLRRMRRPETRARSRRRSPGRLLIPVAAAALVLAALPRSPAPERSDEPAAPSPAAVAQAPEQSGAMSSPMSAPVSTQAWLFDPAPTMGRGTPSLTRPARPAVAAIPDPAPAAVAALTAAAVQAPPRQVARAEQLVPLPLRRPAELERSSEPARAPATPHLAQRSAPHRAQIAQQAAQQAAAADRSFFETVFGAKPSEPVPEPERPQALAYAGVDAEAIAPRRSPAAPSAEGMTAVYNISARTVTLPSGERLEAHSGLGEAMDNPRLVHLRMRGSTPPGTYDLTEREALFHGVRAIRLTPVGGSAAIHGRDGILAHTYMLRQSGASNGCVVFRDYNRFLQAYLRGEIRRLVVVAGNGQDALPSLAERLFGRSTR